MPREGRDVDCDVNDGGRRTASDASDDRLAMFVALRNFSSIVGFGPRDVAFRRLLILSSRRDSAAISARVSSRILTHFDWWTW
jgi:hypothetical protein